MADLARWCVRHPFVVLVLWLVALSGAGAAALTAGSAYTNDYHVPGTESGQARELLSDGFPEQAGDSDTVVWRTDRPDARVDRGGAVEQRMSQTLDEVADLPGVARITSPYDPHTTDRISQDGRTAYATVHFDQSANDLDPEHLRDVVDTAQAAERETSGLDVALGGTGVALTESTPSSHLSEAIGIAVAAVVLLLAFGSLAAMSLPIVTALVSVGTAYLLTGVLGHVVTLADFAPMLGTLVGLGVGIDYALFIVTRHRQALREGAPAANAAERAVASVGRTVVFAGATVCIALLGMLVLRLEFLNGVALAASLTVLLTVLASVTLLPALLGLIGLRALSRRERARLVATGPEYRDPAVAGSRPVVARWSAYLGRHPKLLGGLAAAGMVVLALPVLALHLGTSDQGNGPSSATTKQAYDMLADGFGPGANGPLTLVASTGGDEQALRELPERLRGTEGVAKVTGAALSQDGQVGAVTVIPSTAPQAEETSELVERLRTEVIPRVEKSSELRVHVGGLTAGYDDFASVIVGKLPLFLAVVVTLGSALLLLAFRSLAVPLKAALMNVLAVSASIGVVVAIFQWGWGSGLLGLGGAGPIEPFLPVIMISVLFGLSMDYQVFLVSRMYEEWRRTRDNRRAVQVGLAETGRVINCAAAIMIAVFGAFVLSGNRLIAMFGVALAVAVALDAFVLRTLLVPALMHLLGGANWWLPKWLDRRLPRISVEPGPPAAAESTAVPPRAREWGAAGSREAAPEAADALAQTADGRLLPTQRERSRRTEIPSDPALVVPKPGRRSDDSGTRLPGDSGASRIHDSGPGTG
ncbi:MMPL family transporter [Streptomyces oceani]|uniref:MMPL family transporter n=1 Tax=Streptomyces oceani TaxID=1075402 RepID=UPI000872DC20|nr:MMPL family transporter [Streptomyces oceani]